MLTPMRKSIRKSHVAVAQNASGRNLNVPIYHITEGLPGPTVYIQSSIHGAEVQGNVVIYKLMQALKHQPLKGTVILVPNCNPVGTNIKAGEYTLGRFDPVNGTNWNRGYYYDEQAVLAFADTITEKESIQDIKHRFREQLKQTIDERLKQAWGIGLAQQLNLSLQRIAADADIVLDLHNGPVSTRHIYIPEYAKQAALAFSIPHCIFIPNKFAGALDEASFCPWWTMQDFLKARFKKEYDFKVQAFTLEMGSQEVINFEEGEKDALSILGYLAQHGVVDAKTYQPSDMQRVGVELSNYKTLYTDFGGIVEYVAAPGRAVAKGEVIARVLNIDELDDEHAVHTVHAPCNLIPMLHFPSASVLSGTQLYKCFTNYYDL